MTTAIRALQTTFDICFLNKSQSNFATSRIIPSGTLALHRQSSVHRMHGYGNRLHIAFAISCKENCYSGMLGNQIQAPHTMVI